MLSSTGHGRLDTALEAVVQQAWYGGMEQVIAQDAQHSVGLGSRHINVHGCHHGQLIKWALIARVFVDLFRGLRGLFSLVHV